MLSFAALSETAIAESTTTLDASAFMSGAAATASAGTLEYDAKANTNALSAITATTSITAFDDVDAQANATLAAVTATITPHQFTAFDDVKGAFSAYISGAATATFSLDAITANGKANVVTPAATSTTVTSALGYNAKATTPALTGVYLNILYHDFLDEDAQASTTLTGVSGTGIADWDTVNGINAVNVIFLNTDFERSRTVNIVPYGNYKVYITR